MLLPCEVAVKSLVPALRSAIAKELSQTYGLKQKDVANLIGVTQTAVSKYLRYVRGTTIKIDEIEEVKPMLKEIVVSLFERSISRYELVAKFCILCKIIRRKGLMCNLCKMSNPSIDIQQCYVCSSSYP